MRLPRDYYAQSCIESRNARLSAHQDDVIEREADLISRDLDLI